MPRSFMNALMWAAVASCVLVAPVNAQAMRGNNPFIGVWKVNVERSVYPGPRPPSDQATFYQFTPMPDGSTRFTLSSRNAAGPTMMISIFRVDGRQYPVYNLDQLTAFVQSGKTTNLMRSYRQIDATTVEFTNYTDGVAGNPVIRQLQPDGNTYVQRPATGEGAILLLERVQ